MAPWMTWNRGTLLWLLSIHLQAEKAMEPLGMSLGHDYMGLGAQTGRDGSMRQSFTLRVPGFLLYDHGCASTSMPCSFLQSLRTFLHPSCRFQNQSRMSFLSHISHIPKLKVVAGFVVQPLSCSLTLFFASGVAWSGAWWHLVTQKPPQKSWLLFENVVCTWHRWYFLPQHSQPTCNFLRKCTRNWSLPWWLVQSLFSYKPARSCNKLMGNVVLNYRTIAEDE